LENVLERALIFCDGVEIREQDLALRSAAVSLALQEPETRQGAARPDAAHPQDAAHDFCSLESMEREAIRVALLRCQGNRTKAAEELGVSRKTILNKIKAYGFETL
jgi:two-component system response regulator AtoC